MGHWGAGDLGSSGLHRTPGTGVWPLIGRGEELNLITSWFDDPDQFGGVAIVGPAGVGKSRLVSEAAAAAIASGAEVRLTLATDSARAIPLGAFQEWTSEIRGSPLRLVGAAIRALTTATDGGRVVVAVDDAHMLDALSAFVLHQVARRRIASLIVSIRSGEPSPDAVTALWKERHLRLLELHALSRSESGELLEAVLGGSVDAACDQRMWGYTNGNVLYLRHLVEQELAAGRLTPGRGGSWTWTGTPVVSQTLIDLIDSHIGSVPDETLDVVDLVAVGEPLETRILDTLNPAAVEDAGRRGLITLTPTGSGVAARIGHPLYGEVRRNRAEPFRLRRLRGQVARALAEVGSEDVADTVRLGVLWLDSDLPPEPGLFLRAARAAMMRLDFSLADRLADACLHAGGSIEAAILRGHVLTLMNRPQEAEELLASLDTAGCTDAQLSSILTIRAANFLWALARPRDSWDLIETALQDANSSVRQSLSAIRATQLALAAQPLKAVSLVESVNRSQLPDLSALMSAWGLVIALGDVGRVSEVTPIAVEAYETANRSFDAPYQGVGLAEFHVTALLLAGRIAEARAVGADAGRYCADVPGVVSAVATAVAGMAELGSGRLDVARRQLVAAGAVFQEYGDVSAVCYRFTIVTVEILARLGDVAAAAAWLVDVERRRHPSFVFVESDRMLAGAWATAARGLTTAAVAAARRAADFACEHHQRAREVVSLQTATQFGDTTTAARLTELQDLVEGPRVAAAAAYAVALASGDGDALRAASADFAAMGDMLAAADASAHAAVAYRRAGRRGVALSAAARAQRISAECGGAVSPALREATEPLPFTTREREVVALVAEGLTNREIAEMLGRSVRTVEGHVYQASRRLGAKDREELAAFMHELGSSHRTSWYSS